MTIGKREDFEHWLHGKSIMLGPNGPYIPGIVDRLSGELPVSYSRMIAFCDVILHPFFTLPVSGAAMSACNSALWDETVTPLLFNRYRASVIRMENDVMDTEFTAFESAEFDDLYALSLITGLGRWDAWIVREDPAYVVELSHDGFATVTMSANPTLAGLIANRLSEAGFCCSKI